MKDYEKILTLHQNDLDLTKKLLKENSLTAYLTIFSHYNAKTNNRLYNYLGNTTLILEEICSLLNKQISNTDFRFVPRTSSQNSTDITLTYSATEETNKKTMLVYAAEINLYRQSFYQHRDFRQSKFKIGQQYDELEERIENDSTELVLLEKELTSLESKKTNWFYSEGKKEIELKKLKTSVDIQKNKLINSIKVYENYYDSIFGYYLLGEKAETLYEIIKLLERFGIGCEQNLFKEKKETQLMVPVNYTTIVADFELENTVYITCEGEILKDYIYEGVVRYLEQPLSFEPLAAFGNVTPEMVEIEIGKNKYLISSNGNVQMFGATSSIYDLVEAGVLEVIDEQVKNMSSVSLNEK